MKYTSLCTAVFAVLLTAGPVLADEVVTLGPYGQGGMVTVIKATPKRTTVALFHNGRGVSAPTLLERTPEKLEFRTTAAHGNGGSVSYYAGDK